MYQKFTSLLFCCLITLFAAAQNTKPAPAAVAAPVARPVYDFKTLNPKLRYTFIENKPGTAHPQEGDDIMMRMIAICNNRFLYSSAQLNKGKPAVFAVSKPAFNGDIIEAIMLMTPGDSIICMVDAQAMFNYSKKKLPDYIKPGDKIQYNIRLVSIKPKEQVQKEQQADIIKQMQEQETKQKAEGSQQLMKDDITLKKYFNNKHIMPTKTPSGLYYSIQQQGNGPQAMPGDTVIMNYRGTFLDGTVFDSNLDSAFMHTQPLTFVLGTGRVIKGWDEGIGYLKEGTKAFFYIPSPLAYGTQSRPANPGNPKGIPANSILIFDVELVAARHRSVTIPALLNPAVDSVKKQED
jgi:FKBP-type peptidyl-prolyl cis-trans isomerase